MPVTTAGVVGGPATTLASGTQATGRSGGLGDSIVSELQGRYYELNYRGRLFLASAIVTAPVIYSTAAGTGGPILRNGTTNLNAILLGFAYGVSTASTVAGGIGLTGGTSVALTATTAIDGVTNGKIGAGAPQMSVFRVGTPAAAGGFFLPFGGVDTGAITTTPGGLNYVDLGGMIIVPPGTWVSVAASATLTTLVMQSLLVWAE